MAYCNPTCVYSLLKDQWLVSEPVTNLTIGKNIDDTRLLNTTKLPIIIVIPTNGPGSKAKAASSEQWGAPIDGIDLRYDFIITASDEDVCWTLLSWVVTGLRSKMGPVTIDQVSFDQEPSEAAVSRGKQLVATINVLIYLPRYEASALDEAMVTKGTVSGQITGD